jgi:hypothetical protein
MEVLIPIFGVFGVFGSTAYIAYVILEAIKTRHQSRVASEFNAKLFDRVASAQELGVLLNSEGGERLLTTLTGRPVAGSAQTRIVRALTAGVVIFMLGIGLFLYQWFSPALDIDAAEGITLFSVIALSIGLGLLLASGASYTMSKKLGLLDEPQRQQHGDSVRSA